MEGLTERELATPFNDSLSLSGGEELLNAHLLPLRQGAAGPIRRSGSQCNRAKQAAQLLAGAVNIEDIKKKPSNVPKNEKRSCLISL